MVLDRWRMVLDSASMMKAEKAVNWVGRVYQRLSIVVHEDN